MPQRIPIADGEFYDRATGELLHPSREPDEVIERMKTTLGTQAWQAQYQQNPVPPGGDLIRLGWFQIYKQRPQRGINDRIVQSWDTATKTGELNDYSVCTTWLWKDSDYYLLDVFRKRLEYPELKRKICEHAMRFGARSIIIEDTGAGSSLIQDIRRDRQFKPIAFTPEGEKEMRMAVRTPVIEAGHVWLPESAPWLSDFQAEVMQFPNGKHDDQVDSMSQFLTWLEVRKSKIGRSCNWNETFRRR